MLPSIAPMLAVSGPIPADEGRYAFEPKWDGYRALVYAEGGTLRVRSRKGTDLTGRCPELEGLPQALGGDVLLDGELVVLDDAGRPDFEAMQRRAFSGRPTGQLVFVAFDVLHHGGVPTTRRPDAERRGLLEGLGLDGSAWRTTPAHPGEGAALFAATRDLGLEGVVAKALTSPYRAGVRSRTWVKTKHWRHQTFVVGGFIPPDPARRRPAALLVGAPDAAGHTPAGSSSASPPASSKRSAGSSGAVPPAPSSAGPQAGAPSTPRRSCPSRSSTSNAPTPGICATRRSKDSRGTPRNADRQQPSIPS